MFSWKKNWSYPFGVGICAAGALIVQPSRASAQTSNDAKFDIVSIRPSPAREGARAISRMPILPDGQFVAENVSVETLIRFAYALHPTQAVNGIPKSLAGATVFDVRARGALASPASNNDRAELRAMARSLLAERFKLRARFEDSSRDVFVLQRVSPDRLGTGMRALPGVCVPSPVPETTPDGGSAAVIQVARARCGHIIDTGKMFGTFRDMEEFSRYLSAMGTLPVVDDTGLIGPYEVQMTFNPTSWTQSSPPPFFEQRAGLDHLPSIFDAVRDDLGLSLKREKRTVRSLLVEYVERPSDN